MGRKNKEKLKINFNKVYIYATLKGSKNQGLLRLNKVYGDSYIWLANTH